MTTETKDLLARLPEIEARREEPLEAKKWVLELAVKDDVKILIAAVRELAAERKQTDELLEDFQTVRHEMNRLATEENVNA